MFPFDPPEKIKKPKVFWYFQGDQKGALGSNGLNIHKVYWKVSAVWQISCLSGYLID